MKLNPIFSAKMFLILNLVLLLLFAACADVGAQAFQSGNPGAEPQQSVYYQKAEAAYLNAASQADAAGQPDRAACYRKWATYYHGCAAQLVSGTTFRVGSPPSDDCSGFSGATSASSPATSGAANNSGNSFGITTETFNKLNPGQQGLITGLSALNGLLQQHQQALQQKQQAEENEKDQNKKALDFWVPAAKRFNDLMKQPDFNQFQSESSFAAKAMPNPNWFIDSIQAGGARADLAISDGLETAKEIEKIEQEYTAWQIQKVERDIKQEVDNAALAKQAVTLSSDPVEVHENLIAALKECAGADYIWPSGRNKIKYSNIIDDKALKFDEYGEIDNLDGSLYTSSSQPWTIPWGSLSEAQVTLTENFTATERRPFVVKIQMPSKQISTKDERDGKEEVLYGNELEIYVGSDKDAAQKVLTLFLRASELAKSANIQPASTLSETNLVAPK